MGRPLSGSDARTRRLSGCDVGRAAISDRIADDVSPAASAGTDSNKRKEGRGNTRSAPHLSTLQNAVLSAGVVFMLAVWLAGGWAFIDSFRNPPPSRPAPAAAEKSAPSAPERSAPSVAEKPPASAAEKLPSVVLEKAAAAAETPSLTVQPAQPQSPPTSPAVNPPVASVALQTDTSADLRQADGTFPRVDDKELADPAVRGAIMRGWAFYYLPYTPARWQEASREFEHAFEMDQGSSAARIGLASILSTRLADGWSPVLQEDLPRAESLLRETIDNPRFSNRAAAHFTLGVVRQMQNRLPEARAEFETAVSLDPNNARAYLHLGETLLYLGQPEAAIPPLEQAIRLRPNDGNLAITYWALGTCQLLSGWPDLAIEPLQTAQSANPRLWVPYFYLAGAYGLHGDFEEARSALAESIRLKPAMKSLARMRAENLWLSNPQYWALQEQTLNVGLRRAGLPDQ